VNSTSSLEERLLTNVPSGCVIVSLEIVNVPATSTSGFVLFEFE
jgi:hypothetical protein